MYAVIEAPARLLNWLVLRIVTGKSAKTKPFDGRSTKVERDIRSGERTTSDVGDETCVIALSKHAEIIPVQLL